MAKGYNITTTLKLNDQMSKGISGIVNQINKLNKSLGSISGQVTGMDNLYQSSVVLASGLASASSNGKDLANSLKSVSGAKLPTSANMMSPIPTSTPSLSGGSGLEKSLGPMSSLKSGYQRLVDYSSQLDSNTIGFFRNLRYSMLNTYIIIQGLKSVGRVLSGMTDSVDRYSSSMARLNIANSMMNDGLYTTRELQAEIFERAEKSRMSYEDMVDFASDMTLQSGHAFSNQKEILKFSELINKSFKASGTSIQSQVSGLYQLKQALASNRLQGDEFRSIIENMPQLTNMLRDSLKMSHEELKKLSSEGGITSEIIKQAVFESEDLINDMFDAMPKTFGDTMTHMKNIWGQGMWEFKERFNNFLNSIAGQEIVEGITLRLQKMGEILTSMAQSLPKIMEQLKKFYQFTKDNSALILFIVLGSMLNKIFLEAFNSIVKLVTIFSKLSPTTAIILALAYAVSYWLVSLWEAGYTFQDIANLVIDKLNAVYNYLYPLIAVIGMIIDALIWVWNTVVDVFASVQESVNSTIIKFAYLVMIIAMVGIVATLAFSPLIATIIIVISVVALLIWVIHKIAGTVGWAIGIAVGFFVALMNVVLAVGTLIGTAIGAGMANAVGAIISGVGRAISAFGQFLNTAHTVGKTLGNVFVAGVNIAIGALNKLIGLMNEIPGIKIGTVGRVQASDGIGTAGDGLVGVGARFQSLGQNMQDSASSEFASAQAGLQNSISSFGSTVSSFGDAGRQMGDSLSSGIEGLFGGLSGGKDPFKHFTSSDEGKTTLLDPQLLKSLDGSMEAGGDPTEGGLPGGSGGGSGGSGGKPNIGTVDKVNEVDLSDGTMKLLKNMYERDLFQRFVNIDSSMQFSFVGTANSEDSAEDIASSVDKMVSERLANLLIV